MQNSPNFSSIGGLRHKLSCMTLHERLRLLREEISITQKEIGAQGFVSASGWAKLERGQRSPSDELILRLIAWMRKEGHLSISRAGRVLEELLTLKHLSDSSAFVRRVVRNHAEELFGGTPLRLAEDPAVYRPKPRRKPTHPKAM